MALSVSDLDMLCPTEGHLRRCRRRYDQLMASKHMAEWAYLPAELLEKISEFLHEPIDITLFRSVCRSWRLSRPTNNNNTISPHFPRMFLTCLDPTEALPNCQTQEPKYVIANVVYLVRPRSDPSKSFLVSVLESVHGRFLRHALTDEAMHDCSGYSLDLSSCILTHISISHRILFLKGQSCERCYWSAFYPKNVVFAAANLNSDPINVRGGLMNSELMGLCRYKQGGLCVFRLAGGGGLGHQTRLLSGFNRYIHDFVNFNGRIYAVDLRGTANVYMFDCSSLSFELLPMTCLNPPDYFHKGILFGKRFVVSDGDLYLFCKFGARFGPPWPSKFLIYKLVFEEKTTNCYRLERVENLGDRLFLITDDSSFTMSGGDLPPPLSPNCVIFSRHAFLPDHYRCNLDYEVYYLGGRPSHLRGVADAYSALFTPSPSLLIK